MISLQYFEGCPNAIESMTNFKLALKELNVPDDDIEIVEIPDLQSAESHKFQGSPTILVNGFDIYTDKVPKEYNYTCRIYNFNGKWTGIIPQEFITTKLEEHLT